MIIVLSIVLVLLTVTVWFVSMYSTWKKVQGIESEAFSLNPIVNKGRKAERLARRAYYRGSWNAKALLFWLQKQTSQVFFKLFPSAQPAFAKRNNLTGLKDGPTSYFLMSISEVKEEVPKITRRRRKIV
jgi:hypothetical protein